MTSSALHPENKLQTYILDCWKLISLELCKYCDIANLGKKHIEAYLAHEIALLNVSKAEIKDTELFKMDPDISLKLQFVIKREISSEEAAIENILKDLQYSYVNIMGKIDKITNFSKDCALSSDDMMRESLTCLSTAEMLLLIDNFKINFGDSHDGRKYSLDFYHLTKDSEKMLSAWDTTEIMSLKDELDLKIL